MIGVPLAHIAGVPVEETLGSFTPAFLVVFGAASATLRARLRRARSRDGAPDARQPSTKGQSR
jgi:hypothetical protein